MKSRWILTLFGLYFSAVLVQATETYKVNMAPPGYTLFGNQVDLNPNDLPNTMLGQMLPIKSQVAAWNGTSFNFSTKTPGGWTVPGMTIMRGEGFFCKVPPTAGTFSIPFTGTKSTTPTPIPGFTSTTAWYLLGSQTYAEDVTPGAKYNYYDITGYSTPAAGASVYRSKYAVPGFNPTVSSPIDAPLEWNEYTYDGTWHPFDPEIVLGEGVWIGPSTGNGGACELKGTVTDNLGAPLANWEISLSDGQYTFTDASGNYHFAVLSGEYTVAQIPPCGWATLTDPQGATVNCPGPVVQVPPFRAIRNGINTGPDLAVILIYVPDPGNPAYPCPNDTGSYHVYYYNKCGLAVAAGTTLNVTLSSWVTYGSTVHASWSQTPPLGGSPATASTISPPTLSWTLGALPVSAIGQIRIPVTVSGGVATARPFTQLTTIATIPFVGDADPLNNLYNLQTVAKCSFDPNDKTVDPAGCGPTGLINGNQLLTYTVQFQNLGSAPAFDVVVTDQLDPSLDPSTLKILGASANYAFQLNGRQMTWTFPNIDLPDATDNEPGSHGFISYQVQPLPGLSDGTVITNQSSIVFDKNPPVLTAITTNTITSETLPVASFTVAPRPGSAGHTNDFTYTGGTAGATFFWDFGPDAVPPTSTDMNPSGVVYPMDGLRTVSLQVFSGDCTGTPAASLVSVGQPTLKIASIAGNQIVLSWLGGVYALEEADALNAPIPWQVISPPLMQVGVTSFATLGVTNTMMYYRLTDQP
jgi:uncharacterized repeat protein (TIGR01451 family)